MKEMNKELLKGVIEIFILALILKDDTYGYKLATDIKHITKDKYSIAEGTLYPALKRLTNRGFLHSYTDSGKSSKRVYYKITDEGKKELLSRIKEFKDIFSMVSHIEEECINEKID